MKRELKICNEPLMREELCRVIRKSKRGKAASKDGIPMEVLKLISKEKKPKSAFRVLFGDSFQQCGNRRMCRTVGTQV